MLASLLASGLASASASASGLAWVSERPGLGQSASARSASGRSGSVSVRPALVSAQSVSVSERLVPASGQPVSYPPASEQLVPGQPASEQSAQDRPALVLSGSERVSAPGSARSGPAWSIRAESSAAQPAQASCRRRRPPGPRSTITRWWPWPRKRPIFLHRQQHQAGWLTCVRPDRRQRRSRRLRRVLVALA